ncbi:MAG: S8 family serine peptidase [Alphaproteobacteria bacterium]|nr:S8 family serine peptidase [Alphaproteobacteria bacterium]
MIRNERGERVRGGEVVLVSSLKDVASRVEKQGLHVIEDAALSTVGMRILRVSVPEGSSEELVIETLRGTDPKGVATFNHLYGPTRGPASEAIKAVSHPSGAARTGAKIGLIDAGVDAHHPMLQDIEIVSHRFVSISAQPDQHGTAVASRIAAAAPGASIVSASVFTLMPDGQEIATADSIARGLDWMAKMKVPVINLSLAGPPNPILEAVSARMNAMGHVLVAAVGNEGPHAPPQYPAAYDNVVGVTAVDSQDHVYLYANQGDYVDFAASGVDAPVAMLDGATETVSGTSYAAPIISAALARLIDRPDPRQVKAAIHTLEVEARDLGKPGRDTTFGFGLIGPPK